MDKTIDIPATIKNIVVKLSKFAFHHWTVIIWQIPMMISIYWCCIYGTDWINEISSDGKPMANMFFFLSVLSSVVGIFEPIIYWGTECKRHFFHYILSAPINAFIDKIKQCIVKKEVTVSCDGEDCNVCHGTDCKPKTFRTYGRLSYFAVTLLWWIPAILTYLFFDISKDSATIFNILWYFILGFCTPVGIVDPLFTLISGDKPILAYIFSKVKNLLSKKNKDITLSSFTNDGSYADITSNNIPFSFTQPSSFLNEGEENNIPSSFYLWSDDLTKEMETIQKDQHPYDCHCDNCCAFEKKLFDYSKQFSVGK